MSPWCFKMILLVSISSHTTQNCVCNVPLKSVCVPAGGNVSVPCPKSTGTEVRFSLYQDGETISDYKCKINKLNCEPVYSSRLGVELHENAENKFRTFMLTGVNTSSHSIYRCDAEITIPPPIVKVSSDMRILILMEGHQCNKACQNSIGGEDKTCGFNWIWISGLGLVSFYGIMVTIIATVITVRQKQKDSQSIYVNTKPKG